MSTQVLDTAHTNVRTLPHGITMPMGARFDATLLSDEAQAFLLKLHQRFEPQRQVLLDARKRRQADYDAGRLPTYLDRNSEAVTGDWKVAPVPADLQCRRVEITGPVNSTKMVINMLSRNDAGDRADCAMLDFEDAMKPSWDNVMAGLENVIGAVRGTLTHIEPAKDGKAAKTYKLDPADMAKVMVRARGLHLDESNLRINNCPISGGLMDLALTAFHTARFQYEKGMTPKFYIPKVEHYLEARWWNELLAAIEYALGLPNSTIRATFLIETLSAAHQVEEILYELRDHACGLNVGRWDKIFSDIKTVKYHPDRILADRATINMSRPWMRDYALRLIYICHTRGAFALGGMAAFTPGKDPETRKQQTDKVFADKQMEASWGHDGCWVSHPYFIGWAMKAFQHKNQLDVIPELPDKYPDLLPQSGGPVTMNGLRTNVRVGIAYIYGWQHDIGCIAWDNLMEDLATLEISRAQVWQWLFHGVTLDDGGEVTGELVSRVFEEELARILDESGEADKEAWQHAMVSARDLFLKEDFPPFLTDRSEIAA
ncbi:MAG: malate synthase A [Acidobacteriota bacterium]|nr:malate synthase A [Acidobacteriota bacterium]